MKALRIIFVAVMLVTVLLGHSQPALAGSATHFSVRVDNVSFPWAFPPPDGLSGFCPGVPEGVHINPDDSGSTRVKNVIVNEISGGGKHILWTDLIKGTASDNFGDVYTFVYENNASFDFDGSIVTVAMKDTFKLKGGDVNYTVGFNWRWAYPADDLVVIEIQDGNGQTIDLGVDPFFFATSDGVNEDPNIVPGSWQQIITRGDPWNCDPL